MNILDGMNFLVVSYLGMIFGLSVWTFFMMKRGNEIEKRIVALESSLTFEQE